MECLDDQAVQAWVRGDVAGERSDPVRDHLDGCESCSELVAALLETEWIGQAVGRYQIVELIGGGAMGEVYRASDPDLGRDVAIKVVRRGGSQQRLLREAQAMARVTHPNVIRIYDVGTVGSALFLAMELVQGQTLRSWLVARRRDVREVVTAMRDAGRGLHAAHLAGMVHGDFKPDNVLVADDGRVLVTDFGLAQLLADEPVAGVETTAMASHIIAGTPAYMAPERFDASAAATAASDQFSFCVTLFEALYGQRPFAADDVAALRAVMLDTRPVVPVRRGVSARVIRALQRGLVPAPAERFGSMAQLLSVLDAALAQRTRWIAAGAIGIGLGVSATLWAASTTPGPACDDGDRQFAQAWSPALRAKLETAFAASTLPYAPSALAAVTAAFDRYRDAWVGAYDATCEATHVRHEQSDVLLDVRMQCLSRRRQDAKALLDELSRGTTDAVRDAFAAVTALPAISDCADVSSLQELERAPADPAVRVRVEALHAQLAACRAIITTGQYRAGRACASAAVTTARDIGHRPTLGEAELLLGTVETRLRNWDAASDALERAVLASEGGRDARTRARALTWLVAADSDRNAFPQAHRSVEHANAVLAGLGNDPDLGSELAFHAGVLRLREGKLKDAAEGFEQLTARRSKLYGDHDARVAEPLVALAAVFTSRKQYGEAQVALDRALVIQRTALGDQHPAIGKTYHVLAQLQMRMGKLDEALASQRRSYELLVAGYGESHRDVALSVGLIAQAHLFNGKFDLAIPPAQRAVELMAAIGGEDSPDTAVALETLAATFSRAGRSADALAAHQRVLAIRMRTLGQDHLHTTQAQVNLAMALRIAKRCDEALPLLHAAIAARAKLLGDDHSDVVGIGHTIGDCYTDLGREAEALPWLERVLARRQAEPIHSPNDRVARAMIRYAMARALWASEGSRGRAVTLANHAYAELMALEDRRADSVVAWAKRRRVALAATPPGGSQ
ncbi:MAG: tetratricopeptide repeat protein [Kofleriaceae bacterium]